MPDPEFPCPDFLTAGRGHVRRRNHFPAADSVRVKVRTMAMVMALTLAEPGPGPAASFREVALSGLKGRDRDGPAVLVAVEPLPDVLPTKGSDRVKAPGSVEPWAPCE